MMQPIYEGYTSVLESWFCVIARLQLLVKEAVSPATSSADLFASFHIPYVIIPEWVSTLHHSRPMTSLVGLLVVKRSQWY